MNSKSDINKDTVRRFNLEIIERGETLSVGDLVDAAFVNRSAPPGMDEGITGMLNTFNNILRPAISDMRVHILDQIAEGDKVTTRKQIRGTHTGVLLGVQPTGEVICIDVIDIVRLRQEKYYEHWGVNTLPAVLAALASKSGK